MITHAMCEHALIVSALQSEGHQSTSVILNVYILKSKNYLQQLPG